MKQSISNHGKLVPLDQEEAADANGGIILAAIAYAVNTALVGGTVVGLGGAVLASWSAGVEQGCG